MQLLPDILASVPFVDVWGYDEPPSGGRRVDWVLVACFLASLGVGACVYLILSGANETIRATITLAAGIGGLVGIASFAESRAAWQPRPPKTDAATLRDHPFDINTATRTELESVPGIGPITATRIMDGRPWRRVEDLQHLRGVKRDKFRAMLPYLTVGIEDVRPWKNVRDELIEADERRRSDVSAAP